MATYKPEFTSEFNEIDASDAGQQKSDRSLRIVESVRLALTALALLSSVTVLGTAGDTLSVFKQTHLSEEFFLALWPNEFDIRPTVALVACSAVVIVASAISLVASKVPTIRSKALIHNSISFLAPMVCLIAGLVGTSFFYGVNSSNTTSTLKSWSCQWSDVTMTVKPHWGTLCRESKAALYLTVMLIPLEVIVLGTFTFSIFAKKPIIVHPRKGSPALS